MTWLTLWRLYRRGIRLLSQAIPQLFAAVIAHTLVMAATPYVTVYLFAQLLEELITTRDVPTLWFWAGWILGVQAFAALVGGLLKRVKEAKWDNVYRASDRILIDTLLDMEHAVVSDPATRDLLARVRQNASALGRGLVQIPDVVQNLLYGVFGAMSAAAVTGALVVSADVLPATAGMVLVLIAVMAGMSWLQRKARCAENKNTAAVVALDRLYYAFYDTMFDPRKAADMRLYRQDALMTAYLEKAERAAFEKNGTKRLTVYGGGICRALATALSAVWLGSVLAFAAWGVDGGAFTLGAAVCLSGAWTRLLDDTERFRWGYGRMQQNAPYLETMFAFLDTPHKMYRGSLTTEKRADRAYEVEFRHVSFRYPGQQTDALSDVSVTLRAGNRLAIVGENGSGKSTFVKLLCRLYEPDEGEILLNGIDIRKYEYEEYVALIAAVFQDFQLFARPLGENVAGSREYDVARVTACLEEAGFGARLYEWNDGLQTPLGGMTLSAADAGRIAIARALYKNAPLLILDEPTAALDPVAEAALYEGLDRLVGDRTAVYISHRLASCRFCNEILVFDGGRIVQRGTHEELVAQTASKYHALWQAQAQYYTGE